MPSGDFRSNDWPTLGVEVEIQLVDAATLGLKSDLAIAELRAGLPADLVDSVKPEFMQCYVEINTRICHTVAEVEQDLSRKTRAVEQVASRLGVSLFWSGTHPFSRWRDQRITPVDRYYRLAERFQEALVRQVTFGLHVHVGVDSGDRAIAICNGLVPYLPLLLALSANSPFWHSRPTGYHSYRIELLEGLPTGGLPPQIRTWDEYRSLVDRMVAAGFIDSPKELWWDIRPNAENGTVEVRICDMPVDLPSVVGLVALIQCLVHFLSVKLDRGGELAESLSLMVRQNRWRACRYGRGADLVDLATNESRPAVHAAETLLAQLHPVAIKLGCARQLALARNVAALPTGAERQLSLFGETGSLTEVVRQSIRRSTLMAKLDSPGLVIQESSRSQVGQIASISRSQIPG